MAPRGADRFRKNTFSVLLVEDADGDASIAQAYLEDDSKDRFVVTRTLILNDALEHLRRNPFDAVILDLTLPDAGGTSAVGAIRDLSGAPIIVLTGSDDEAIAQECLAIGAEDYVRKSELHGRSLPRAVGYAIMRRREAELRMVAEARDSYTVVSTRDPEPQIASRRPLRIRDPESFRACALRYYEMLLGYTAAMNGRTRPPRAGMREIADRLGRLDCAPRDLIALHAAALELGSSELPIEKQCEIVVEGRLFALEMMGVLLEFYRSPGEMVTGSVDDFSA